MTPLLDVEKARKELEEKDLLAIERETAKTWGGRAAASYANALEDEDHAEQMRSFWEAETYRAEAVEHAAMTEDAHFVSAITKEIEGYRAKARDHLLAAGHAFVQGNRTPKAHRGARPMTTAQPAPAEPPQPPSRAQRLANRSQPQPQPAQASAPPAAPPAPVAPAAPGPAPTSAADRPVTFEPVNPAPARRPPGATPGLGRRPDERSHAR